MIASSLGAQRSRALKRGKRIKALSGICFREPGRTRRRRRLSKEILQGGGISVLRVGFAKEEGSGEVGEKVSEGRGKTFKSLKDSGV